MTLSLNVQNLLDDIPRRDALFDALLAVAKAAAENSEGGGNGCPGCSALANTTDPRQHYSECVFLTLETQFPGWREWT